MRTRVLTRGLRLLAFMAVLSVSTAASLQADPIAVTSGRFVIAWDDPTFFIFEADGLRLVGADSFPFRLEVSGSPQQTCFGGCAPGTTVNMSVSAGGDSSTSPFPLGTSFGDATVNGTTVPGPVGLAGTLRFDAPAIVLPPITPGTVALDLRVPFLFNGNVSGFAANDLDRRQPLFQVSLTGQGTARYLVDVTNGRYDAPEARYEFAASPTPEPATLGLLGIGLAGYRAFRRKNSSC